MECFEDPRIIAGLCEHFVSLSGKYIQVDSTGNQVGDDFNFAFSAFVIDIEGVWCLVTAGHVIDKLDELTKHPQMKLLRCGLADFFGNNAKIKEPTPFAYEGMHKINIDEDGFDIGLIPLRDFYRDSLKANGIIPLPVALWEGYLPPKCDAYCVMGLPEETPRRVEPSSSRGSGISSVLTLVPLKLEPTPHEKLTTIPRFVATLFDGGQLQSPKGMSGGPIVGIRKKGDGGWSYACIAVQGSWDKERRMIFGTPVSLAVNTIIQLLLAQAGAK